MDSHISLEKKLQLVKKIRQEHQLNQNTVRGREAFLYGRSMPYKNDMSAWDSQEAENGGERELPVSTFRLRAVTALFLFALFYALSQKGETVLGIGASQVYEAVEEDYSSILFDFVRDIPYTFPSENGE